MNNKIERVAAYIRVSTQEQKLHGLSLDAQRMKLTDYAAAHNMKIIGWYVDEGVSGRKLIKRRPELLRMIQDAEKGLFDRIIFIKLDRFFRSVAEYHECMKRISPVLWTATEEEYDLTTANGKMLVNMKLTIAELEADQTGERIDLVNEYKVQTGQPLSGSVKFPWMIVKDGDRKRIVKNPDTIEMTKDLLHHIWKHQSKRAVTLYINTKYGTDFSYNAIDRLLDDTLLYGEYRGNKNYLPPEECYMIEEDFIKMHGFLKRQVRQNTVDRDYLFTGLIACPCCGWNLKGTIVTSRMKSGNLLYYKKYRCQKHSARGTCEFNKAVSENTFERMMLENVEEYLKYEKIKSAEIEEAIPQLPQDKVADIQAEINRLNYAWQKGRISDVEKYDRDYDALMEKLEKAKEEVQEVIKHDFSNAEAALAGGWKELYNSLDDAHKRSFWRSFIESIEISWTTEKKEIVRINFF